MRPLLGKKSVFSALRLFYWRDVLKTLYLSLSTYALETLLSCVAIGK